MDDKVKLILVYNEQIAEALVYEHKLSSLAGIIRSNKTHGKWAFEFIVTDQLMADLQAMIEDVREQKNQRMQNDRQMKPEPESVEETVSSVNDADADVMNEDAGKPKSRRGRKKKSEDNNEI